MKTFLILLSFLFVSCSDSNFRKIEQLDGFRILAIEANNPEVAPGGNATLELFVSDPKGPAGGRTINGTTVACVDPGISVGAPVSCALDPNRVNGTYTIDTSIPDLLNNLFTGFTGSINVTVPNTILAGRSTRDQTNGVGYIVIFNFTIDGKDVTVFKRIMATNRGTLNANPTGSSMLLNGAAIAGMPHKDDLLDLTPMTPETYTYINVDGSSEVRTEVLDVAWYISEAELNRPKADFGEEVKITKEPPTDPYLIIGIVRDDRGGVEVVRNKIP